MCVQATKCQQVLIWIKQNDKGKTCYLTKGQQSKDDKQSQLGTQNKD